MTGTLVKICGVRSPEIARAVAGLGGDLLGLVFAPSKRRVTVNQAEEVLTGLDESERMRLKVVGVFVNESPERINDIIDRLDLDYVQLSGDEPVETQAKLTRPVIRALRLPAGLSFSDARLQADRYLDCQSPARALLLDAHSPGAYGGTGVQSDWDLAARLAERYPVFLAGGLRPDTVERALDSVHPLGVDVSSGVETGGDKDRNKIRDFMESVRRGDQFRAGRATNDEIVRSHS